MRYLHSRTRLTLHYLASLRTLKCRQAWLHLRIPNNCSRQHLSKCKTFFVISSPHPGLGYVPNRRAQLRQLRVQRIISLGGRAASMNKHPVELLVPIFRWLDAMIIEHGLTIYMVAVWLSPLLIAWILSGGFWRRRPRLSIPVHPPPRYRNAPPPIPDEDTQSFAA